MNKAHTRVSANGILFNHLAGAALANEIKNAEYIICRGGYTSLMELIPFEKKLIFVPTPGQTEQTYLGQYWQNKKWAVYFEQHHFNLATALSAAANLPYTKPPFIPFTTDTLKAALKQLPL
jgi:UDP-N-acetylglucosamine:LPS N-acetylglucosamine transferase